MNKNNNNKNNNQITINYYDICIFEHKYPDENIRGVSLYKYLTINYTRDQLQLISYIDLYDSFSELGCDLSELCPNLLNIVINSEDSYFNVNFDELRNCVNLEYICLQNVDGINNFDISYFKKLKKLHIYDSNTILENVIIENDNIKYISLSTNDIKHLEINCPQLNTLVVKYNHTNSIKIHNAPLLEILEINNNNISILDLEDTLNLKLLDIGRNEFRSLDDIRGFYDLSKLCGLDIRFNPLITDINILSENFPKLKRLCIQDYQDLLLNKLNIINGEYSELSDYFADTDK